MKPKICLLNFSGPNINHTNLVLSRLHPLPDNYPEMYVSMCKR